MRTTNWTEATQALQEANTILVVTHIHPDGDAIGSLLGLTNALREQGKRVDAVVDDGVPEFLQFLPAADTVLGKLQSGEWDVMVSLDSSDEERTGDAGAYGRAHSRKVINLDHHPTNTLFGDILLVDAESPSTAEIVFEWLQQMGHRLSLQVATPLLTGIVTDTLGFRTSNVTVETLRRAQVLMEAGAPLASIVARTLSSKPYGVINLWKRVLPSVELQDSIIAATITQADLQEAKVADMTDGGLISVLISVNEAAIAVVFKELADGQVELSFRSKPGFDVAQVAFSLGGGGHKQASGATIAGPLEAAKSRVMPLLHEAVQQGSPTLA